MIVRWPFPVQDEVTAILETRFGYPAELPIVSICRVGGSKVWLKFTKPAIAFFNRKLVCRRDILGVFETIARFSFLHLKNDFNSQI